MSKKVARLHEEDDEERLISLGKYTSKAVKGRGWSVSWRS